MPYVRTRAWSVQTRRSTRGSWRGIITGWRRHCSPSSTERSLSFINLCCRSTHTGKTEQVHFIREREREKSRWCVMNVKFFFFCFCKNHAANGQLDKVVWDFQTTFCESLCLLFVLWPVSTGHSVSVIRGKFLELYSRKAGKTIQGTEVQISAQHSIQTCDCFVLHVWKPSVVKISITKTNV